MPINNVSEYLKSAQKNGQGATPLVGMGQIIAPPPKKSNWGRAILASLMFVAVGVGGLFTYNATTSVQPTFTAKDQTKSSSIEARPQIVAIEEDKGKEPIVAKEKKRSFFGWLFGDD